MVVVPDDNVDGRWAALTLAPWVKISALYPAIIDETIFWAVQERFKQKQKDHEAPKKNLGPLPLAHLVYCGNHEVERKMYYSNRDVERGNSYYTCEDAELRNHCVNLSINILKPIEEAVISQIALPGLAKKVLNKLTDEYQQAKEQAASYRREMKRLKNEVSNLRTNLAMGVLGADQIKWIDEQINSRLARIAALGDLEQQPAGVMGQPTPGQVDIEMVEAFLSNLPERWPTLPNGLKNSFLRLLLDKVVIYHRPKTIRAKIVWRVGRLFGNYQIAHCAANYCTYK